LPPPVRFTIVVGVVAASLLAAAGAAGEAPALPALSGTFAFACSGCPQNPSGASLFVVRADGSGFRTLVRSGAPYNPRWSPGGKTIAFSNGFEEIWTVGARTGTRRRLTHTTRSPGDDAPAWSPDGRRIVFSRAGTLYTMTAMGKRIAPLLRGRRKPEFDSPDWSHDGRRIAFDRRGSQLFVVRADGSRLRHVPSPFESRFPRWSPDGKLLAFVALGSPPKVVVARADGSHAHVVVSRDDLNWNVNAAWSPDGRRLAFVVSKTYDEAADLQGNEIVTVRLDGSDVRRVVIPELPLETYSEIYGLDWTAARIPSR
jgi:TolB protein